MRQARFHSSHSKSLLSQDPARPASPKRRIKSFSTPWHTKPDVVEVIADTNLAYNGQERLATAANIEDKDMLQWEVFQKQTHAKKRNFWLKGHIQSAPEGHFHKDATYLSKRNQAYQVWRSRDWEDVKQDLLDWSRKGLEFRGPGRPKGAAGSCRRSDDQCIAAIFTWNFKFGPALRFSQLREKIKAVDKESEEYKDLMQELRELPWLKKQLKGFHEHCKDIIKALGATEFSRNVELSLNGDSAELHGHLVLSVLQVREKIQWFALDLEKPEKYSYGGCFPDITRNKVKGRGAVSSVHRAHSYLQSSKTGVVESETNFSKGDKFVCPWKVVIHLWQVRKISSRAAKEDLVMNRDNVERALHVIDASERAEQDVNMRFEQRRVQSLLKRSRKPFKTFPAVEKWKRQYDGQLYGQATRFLFLVLVGESRWGKTEFAKSLWGAEQTYICDCQQAPEPNFSQWRYGHDKAIVFDECRIELAAQNKAIMQANSDGCWSCQSRCQQHARWLFLYGVPLIICTNSWDVDQIHDEDLKKWVLANQVLVEVSDFMYVE